MAAPTYIQSMTEYQVRLCSGTYAPTNGIDTIEEATPAEWDDVVCNFPLTGVIVPWSGGFKATTGTKLWVHGGGHNDSANNGLYCFDFSGTTAPTGWSVYQLSAVAAIREGDTYTDGRPVSIHSYDGLVCATNGYLYRFGGCWWNAAGGFTNAAWKYNIAGNQWTQLTDFPAGGGALDTIYDPETGKILVGLGHSWNVAIFDTADDSWSAVIDLDGRAWDCDDVCGAYDTSRNRGIVVGDSYSSLVTINWASETVSLSDISIALDGTTAPSCVYDAARDVYWVWGGPVGGGGWSTLYEVNAATFSTVATHALTGGSIGQAASMIGSYGRFAFLGDWRAIGLVADTDTPAAVIRLPNASSSPPEGTITLSVR